MLTCHDIRAFRSRKDLEEENELAWKALEPLVDELTLLHERMMDERELVSDLVDESQVGIVYEHLDEFGQRLDQFHRAVSLRDDFTLGSQWNSIVGIGSDIASLIDSSIGSPIDRPLELQIAEHVSDIENLAAALWRSQTTFLITFSPEFYTWLLEDATRLRQLSDEDFERLVADRLSARGLGVRRIGEARRKDGGIDIVAWPERNPAFPFLLAVQAKHHRTARKTGVADVRDFSAALLSGGSCFHFGMIVTNTTFTADAKWFAARNERILRLRDLRDLCRWMQDDFVCEEEWREIPDQIELAPGVSISIPKKQLWLPPGADGTP